MLVDKEKMKEVIVSGMKVGFTMGSTAMRLKVMETLMPYLDNEIIDSKLLTIRDVIKMVGESLTEFDMNSEFDKMKETMDGLMTLDGNDNPLQS